LRKLLRVAGVLLVVAVAGAGACYVLLPERFAVNGPIDQLLLGRGIEPPAASSLDARFRTPTGTRLTQFAVDLPNARFLRFTRAGGLLVSQPREGRVTLVLPDRDGDGRSDGRREVIGGLNRPHGLDLRGEWLYVAETDAVGRVRFDPQTGRAQGSFERVVTGLPGGGNHWTRTLRFGRDGWMYVSVGSSCNACVEKDRRRAAIVRYRPDGSGEQVFATGLRNAVGFDWGPDGALYATDNGRDLLGDDFPPCELNKVVEGGFYGWPFANGDRVPDPDYGEGQRARIAASTPPVHGFRAHNAPLGIAFLRGDGVPAAYRGAAVVALHGSWNRRRKDGYKVVSLHWGAGRIEERELVVGFLGTGDDDVIGRPVDVAEGPDGSVYISDDYAGAVYRLAWSDAGARGADASQAGAAPAVATAADPAAVARGRALWDNHACAACHDARQAAPGMVTRPLAGLARKYSRDSLAAYLLAPNPPMPAYPLAESERKDLAAHLLATHP
jgi:glucose/arabinose dehydrogenase